MLKRTLLIISLFFAVIVVFIELAWIDRSDLAIVILFLAVSVILNSIVIYQKEVKDEIVCRKIAKEEIMHKQIEIVNAQKEDKDVVVRCGEIKLVNKKGEVVVNMHANDAGGVISICNNAGEVVISMNVGHSGGGVSINDNEGEWVVGIGAIELGGVVQVCNKLAKHSGDLRYLNLAGIIVTDGEGSEVTKMTAIGDRGFLLFRNNEGELVECKGSVGFYNEATFTQKRSNQ